MPGSVSQVSSAFRSVGQTLTGFRAESVIMIQLLGWMVVTVGGAIVVAIPLLFLLVPRSRFLPRNPDRRREASRPLWRLLPVWMYLALATAKVGYDLLSDAQEPRWLLPAGFLLCGMVFWSTVESLLSARQRSSQEKREKEAIRHGSLGDGEP